MIPEIHIKDLVIIDNLLEISAKVLFKSNNEYKPRMGIIFSNATENRRFPFIVSGFNRDTVSDICSISLNWKYQLEHVFWNKENIEDINIDFSLLYGDDFIENFSIISESDFFTKNIYYAPKLLGNKLNNRLDNELNNKLVLKSNKNELKARNLDIKKYSSLQVVNSFILLFIAILAFPFFLIDGFLASKGINIKSPDFFRGNTNLKSILFHINWRTYNLSGHMYSKRLFKIWVMKSIYWVLKHKKVKENRVLFLSERRNDLTGNFEFVYNVLKEDERLEIIHFMKNKKINDLSFIDMVKYVELVATSKIILLDDFYPNIHNFRLKKSTKLIQLWHAVGAFKTFGFSRLGKIGGTSQKSPNHRNYDYAIVSSDEIRRFYGEGFGISDEKVLATGIPRTDVFFNLEYKNQMSEKLYSEYPLFKDKKIILFAPTFRGLGKDDAFYPMDKFNIEEFFDSLDNKEEYILIIKHHPFITKKTKIPEKYREQVIDLSEKSEINDLLFITDLLITDYSSVIFEASILKIPMLFYSYDLEEYIRDRDFYYDYRAFVPGKIVKKFNSIPKSINNNDFASFKVETFKNKFFNELDGKSSERVVNLINKMISNK